MESRLISLSPSNWFQSGHLLIVLKSYFDGSGKLSKDRWVSLGGCAGEQNALGSLENVWDIMLKARTPAAPHIHMSAMLNLGGKFSKDKGWTDPKVDKLIDDALRLLACWPLRNELVLTCCAVDVFAYRKLERLGASMFPLGSVFAGWSVGAMLDKYVDIHAEIATTDKADIFLIRTKIS